MLRRFGVLVAGPVVSGRMIMMVWAVTQHYADFDAQVEAVLGPDVAPAERFGSAQRTVASVILGGLRPR